MRKPLHVIHLPKERQIEVEERCLRAWGPLGPMITSRFRQGEWHFWTLLQEEDWEPGLSLDAAWFWARGVDNPDWVLSQWIADFLRGKPGRLAIFENSPARKGDPFIANWPSVNIVYMGDQVYSWVGPGASVAAVEEAIRFARSASWDLGMVVDSTSWGMPKEIGEDDLKELASKAVSMIFDAFDGCSYVVAEMTGGLSIVPEQQR
jgi:hypothetical protein